MIHIQLIWKVTVKSVMGMVLCHALSPFIMFTFSIAMSSLQI